MLIENLCNSFSHSCIILNNMGSLNGGGITVGHLGLFVAVLVLVVVVVTTAVLVVVFVVVWVVVVFFVFHYLFIFV